MIIFKASKSDIDDIMKVKAIGLKGNTLFGEKII